MSVPITDHRVRGGRALRRIIVLTALIGVLAAIAMGLGTAPEERTFAAVSGPTQSLMSVTVPFLGVLLVSGLDRPARVPAIWSAIATALGLALTLAAFGVAVCALVTAIAPSTASAGRWQDAGLVAVGSLLVQGTAQLTGTGLGLLLRRPVLAGLATTVLPLGLWGLLGAVDALRPVQAWLTPFPSAQHLLSGEMSPTAWAQWLVVLTLWGVGLNALGIVRACRSHIPA